MSFKRFGQSDIIRNAMRAYPYSSFLIYSSSVYYDQKPIEQGKFSTDILSASGGISLFEYNVDRTGSVIFEANPDDDDRRNLLSGTTALDPNPPIIPFVIKGSSREYLKSRQRVRHIIEGPTGLFEITASGPMQEVSDDYANASNGDVLTGSSYVMSASIVRELIPNAGDIEPFLTFVGLSINSSNPALINVVKNDRTRTAQRAAYFYLNSFGDVQGRPRNRHYYGLRESLNFYGTRSPHYYVNFSASNLGSWNKDTQDINLISVPKIFYGTRIKPGSMSLKFYITGTLVGELQDTKQNGELIQVGPPGSNGSGSVAGVAMYDEGFALLTGSWKLTDDHFDFTGVGTNDPTNFKTGSWLYFAAGANDGITNTTTSASFDFSFRGHTETQVLTMYAHARRGEVNFSNNPTFLDYTDAQSKIHQTSSNIYQEKDTIKIKNTVSSSHAGMEAPFERQVYVSRIAIYDDDKKLIGVATLSNPVLKKEAQDLSFKLKLDI